MFGAGLSCANTTALDANATAANVIQIFDEVIGFSCPLSQERARP
jgi:hypothetical protein